MTFKEILKDGENCAILAVGSMVDLVIRDYEKICSQIAFSPTVVNARFIKPIDTEILDKILRGNNKIITIEEGSKIGGFGSFILNYANQSKYKGEIRILGIDDNFVEQGSRSELLNLCGLNSDTIIQNILDDW